MAVLEFDSELKIRSKKLYTTANLTLPIVLFYFHEGVIEILRCILLRLQIDTVLHAKKRVGGKIVVALGTELQHHRKLEVRGINALLASSVQKPNGVETFVIEYPFLKRKRWNKAKADSRGA